MPTISKGRTWASHVIGNDIYVVVGASGYYHVLKYDTVADIWETIDQSHEGVLYFASAGINNSIYLIGGAYGQDVATVERLDIGDTTVSSLSVLLEETETVRMSVTDNFGDNSQYTWTSSDPSVASVVNGTVTALSPGLTYILAESADGTFRESIPVGVVGQGEADERLAVHLSPSGSKNLYLNDDIAAITWSSMDTEVASVDTAGKVTGVGSGLTIVQARYQDETHQVYVRVS